MKLRVNNGNFPATTFDLPEENLWLEVIDDSGEPRFVGSLYVVRQGDGAIAVELGTPENENQRWEPQNPIRVENAAIHPALILTEKENAR